MQHFSQIFAKKIENAFYAPLIRLFVLIIFNRQRIP